VSCKVGYETADHFLISWKKKQKLIAVLCYSGFFHGKSKSLELLILFLLPIGNQFAKLIFF
jgi:hypothetical protein